MYQNGEGLDEQTKIALQKQLVEAILSALENDRISVADMRESSSLILDTFDKLENKAQCILFLENLKNKWPIFDPIFANFKRQEMDVKEQEVMNKLTQFIHSMN